MTHHTPWVLALIAVCALRAAAPAFAADPGAGSATPPGREAREKMAAIHQKMAECLRSERPFDECRAEMRSSCRETMSESRCPMMEDDWGMHRGRMGGGRGHGMGGQAPAAQTPKNQ
jgi:hypothetical protein